MSSMLLRQAQFLIAIQNNDLRSVLVYDSESDVNATIERANSLPKLYQSVIYDAQDILNKYINGKIGIEFVNNLQLSNHTATYCKLLEYSKYDINPEHAMHIINAAPSGMVKNMVPFIKNITDDDIPFIVESENMLGRILRSGTIDTECIQLFKQYARLNVDANIVGADDSDKLVMKNLLSNAHAVQFVKQFNVRLLDAHIINLCALNEQQIEQMTTNILDIQGMCKENTFDRFLTMLMVNEFNLEFTKSIKNFMERYPDRIADNMFDDELALLLSMQSGFTNEERETLISLAGYTDKAFSMIKRCVLNKKIKFLKTISKMFKEKNLSWITNHSVLTMVNKYINPNSLNENEIKQLYAMDIRYVHCSYGDYTFNEFKSLYKVRSEFCEIYKYLNVNKVKKGKVLDIQDIDEKLIRINQVINGCKGNLSDIDAEYIGKQLSWHRIEYYYNGYSYINGVTLTDVLKLMCLERQYSHIIADITNRMELEFFFDNYAEGLFDDTTLDEAKEKFVVEDKYCKEIFEKMELTDEFKQRYEQQINNFCLSGNAKIACTYMSSCSSIESLFKPVIKAEMAGKLREMKFLSDDISRELEIEVPEHVKQTWQENMYSNHNDIEVRETYDFKDTLMIGEQPTWTCQSYINGSYNQSLLSNFDYNKKIVYISHNGNVVGRAIIRLTKMNNGKNSNNKFKYVDIENLDENRDNNDTELILFVEKLYHSGVNSRTENQVAKELISLMSEKASQMGVTLVISDRYSSYNCLGGYQRVNRKVYISKTKANSQYLDSLGGEAKEHNDGRYYNASVYTRK